MILRFTFKNPDVVGDTIMEAVQRTRPEGLLDSEWDTIREDRAGVLEWQAAEWFKWGEYVTVEWNTEDNTCRVIKPQ